MAQQIGEAEAERRARAKAAEKAAHTRRVNERVKKLRKIFDGLPDGERILAYDMIDNFAWLSVAVQEQRELLDKQAFVVTYDNGGGQKGIRENPNLSVYHKLQQRYADAYVKLLRTLPREAQDERDELEKFIGL